MMPNFHLAREAKLTDRGRFAGYHHAPCAPLYLHLFWAVKVLGSSTPLRGNAITCQARGLLPEAQPREEPVRRALDARPPRLRTRV